MVTDQADRCSCGREFLYRGTVGALTFWYWCPNCDAHATGCADRTHPPGNCRYPPTSKGAS